ncbi:MAG: hypothetical protein ABI616_05415 [Pseudomonadota bacterium]
MNTRMLLSAVCLLVLAACSREPKVAPPAAPGASTATGAPGAAPAAPVNTVAAVREGPGDAAIKVRFLLEKPMVVGQEGQLRLDFSSYISGAVTVDVKFDGDQIRLQPGAEVTSVSLPHSGEEVSHTLTLTPLVGLSELKVHVTIAGEEGGPEATYVVPVLADKPGVAGKPTLSDKAGPAGEANHANP